MSEIILHMKGIVKSYRMGDEEQVILNQIDFDLQKGEFVSILGPSGSGKTTLMNIIGCLDTANRGDYILANQAVKNMTIDELARIRNREIGFIFQQFHLLPRLSALQNVELPLIYAGLGEKERKLKAADVLARVGLAGKKESRPNQLSGGQQQRVAIARAMVTEPTLLLADEPTGALDQNTSQQIMELFHDLHMDGKTIVMITHDQSIAQHGDRVMYMLDGKLHELNYGKTPKMK